MSSGRRPSAVGRTTELRNLDPQDAKMLGHILDNLEGWQLLMECIPRAQNDQTTFENPQEFKYSFNDICKIKEASQESNQYNAAQILFDEWGTSGRIRPTLGHLMQLLVQSNLYRAADFLAVEILKEDPPVRPLTGIGARVDITLPPPDVPTVRPTPQAAAPVVVVVDDVPNNNGSVPESQRTDNGPNLNRTASKAGPSLVQKLNDHISDFIEFSRAQQLAREQGIDEADVYHDVYDEKLPMLSIFNKTDAAPAAEEQPQLASMMPMLSLLNLTDSASTSDEVVLSTSSGGLPAFSLLQDSRINSRLQLPDLGSDFVPAFTSLLNQREDVDGRSVVGNVATHREMEAAVVEPISDLMPALSMLQMTDDSQGASFNVPDFSALGSSSRD